MVLDVSIPDLCCLSYFVVHVMEINYSQSKFILYLVIQWIKLKQVKMAQN